MIRLPERWLPSALAVVGLLTAFTGVATAHLAGFFADLEDPIRQAAIARFSTDVLQGATFYLLEAALLAKGITYFLGPSFDTILSRAARAVRWVGWLGWLARIIDAVRRKALAPLSVVILALWFTYRYVGYNVFTSAGRPTELVHWFYWAIALGLPLMVAEGLSARNLRRAFSERSTDEEARSSRLAMGASVAILLAVSFQTGAIRYDRLATSESIVFQDGQLSGRFNMIATNTTDALLLERFGDLASRHVLRTPRMILYEPPDATFAREFDFHWPESYRELASDKANERGAQVEVRSRHDGQDRVRFHPRVTVDRSVETTLGQEGTYPDGPF